MLAAISLESNSINTRAASVNHAIEGFSGESKIFQNGEVNLLLCQYFPENSKKMKEIGHRGMRPWRGAPLDSLMGFAPVFTWRNRHCQKSNPRVSVATQNLFLIKKTIVC